MRSVGSNPTVPYLNKQRRYMYYTGEGKFIKRTGGSGSHGHCLIQLKGRDRGTGVIINNNITNGDVPVEYHKSIESGIREALNDGYLAGYPIVDIEVNMVGGSYHNVDSKPSDFKQAAILAVKDALKKSDMMLLEPIGVLEVTSSGEYNGTIIGDITKRRGKITEVSDKIIALVPISEFFGYATDLRSMTKGSGSFNLTPSHYAEAPKFVVDKLTI